LNLICIDLPLYFADRADAGADCNKKEKEVSVKKWVLADGGHREPNNVGTESLSMDFTSSE
jgi:hypothetical protein